MAVDVSRRGAMLAPAMLAALSADNRPAGAVGSVAGRLPGLAPEPGALDGVMNRYTRPAGKSGGHGIGWSEFRPYTFTVPADWEEVAVSIADLGGTELDLRFESPDRGASIAVVVAPQARFRDTASSDIARLGSKEQLISAFAPEIVGEPLLEDTVLSMEERVQSGTEKRVYMYELEGQPRGKHVLVSMLADGNRLYIFSVKASAPQFRRNKGLLLESQSSFNLV